MQEKYGKDAAHNTIAESWEVSCHPDGFCRVADGPYAGRTLFNALKQEGRIKKPEDFPFLVKLIDAKQALSVQVHPKPDPTHGISGKTEFWHILSAREDAKIAYGVSCPLSPEDFTALCQNGGIAAYLNYIPVHAGESFLIKAGTVHAIGAGILLAEVQQNSNETYRLYDYGRKRPLHLKEGVAAADLAPNPPVVGPCRYFDVKRIAVNGFAKLQTAGRDGALTVIEGSGVAGGLPVQTGTSVFLPAEAGKVTVQGHLAFLLVWAKS